MTPATDDLIRDLGSPDEATRRYAAEDLAAAPEPAAVPALAGLLADPSAAVREAAVDALAAVGVPAVPPVLAVLRSEDAACRNAACEVLRAVGEPAVGRLAELLADDDADVRLFAVEVLAQIGGRAACHVLAAALADRNINVAAAAASALGDTRADDAVPDLVGSLKVNAWVRCAVAKSLGQIGGRQAVRALVDLLGDEDESVAWTAARGLGEVGNADTLQHLLFLLDHPNPLIVAAALEPVDAVTARMPATDADALRGRFRLDPMLDLLRRRDPLAVRPAVRLCARLGGPSAARDLVPVLADACEQGDDELRDMACGALRAVGLAGMGEDFAAADVVPSAARAVLAELLGSHGGPGEADQLLGLIADPDPRVRRAAARGLAARPAGAGGERLLHAARTDPDAGVRYECLKAVAAARPPGAVESLLNQLDAGPGPLELIGLVECLGAFRDPRGARRLRPYTTHTDPEVRAAAAVALAGTDAEDN